MKTATLESSRLFRFLCAIGFRRFIVGRCITVWGTVYYPEGYGMTHEDLAHEKVHIEQWRRWGIFLPLFYNILPLPILFTGRWFFERRAYLVDVNAGADIEIVVNTLWRDYLWPWPRRWMREWFKKNKKA